jgi:hypothetical protein
MALRHLLHRHSLHRVFLLERSRHSALSPYLLLGQGRYCALVQLDRSLYRLLHHGVPLLVFLRGRVAAGLGAGSGYSSGPASVIKL